MPTYLININLYLEGFLIEKKARMFHLTIFIQFTDNAVLWKKARTSGMFQGCIEKNKIVIKNIDYMTVYVNIPK